MILKAGFIFFCCFLGFCFCAIIKVNAGKAACSDSFFWKCYGVLHSCPPGCPGLCEVNCRLCKPYSCDKPGAVCQDPRFIGGDGIMFYFHGEKDKNFFLVSDTNIHVNAHFIGKRSNSGRDFTWVQSTGILFKSHALYIGAKKVAKWEASVDYLEIELDGQPIEIPTGRGQTWRPSSEIGEIGLMIQRQAETNKAVIKKEGQFEIVAVVVPITKEESRVHGYDVTEGIDCFAHLELNFKFQSLSQLVDGVMGQTYRESYKSPVKIEAAMPIMGKAEKFACSHLFATDCAISKYLMSV